MTGLPALSPAQAACVRSILDAHLPPGTQVSLFGSRATGQNKPWSDLDLALEGEQPLPLAVIAQLAEAFEESDLPWKVDLIDVALVSDEFRQVIAGSAVPF